LLLPGLRFGLENHLILGIVDDHDFPVFIGFAG
jgi:hypothetical protein